jgi:aminoglycoside phosphotransferase (APT) family kinase protein
MPPADIPKDMTLETLRALLIEAFPEIGGGQFGLLAEGWDSVAVDVDDRLIFKFPRHENARKALIMEAGLLSVIRPAIDMPVPDIELFETPRLFSRHVKLKGEHLLSQDYERLPVVDRDRLAAAMGLFYAQLHALNHRTMEAAGAVPIGKWLEPDDILKRACPLLPPDLAAYAERTIKAWQDLPPDPYGTTYGFFDGHGWNMAFDHAGNRLNGVFDFADSGFGDLQQDFIYSNFIAPDLTERIIAHYEALTGRAIDRERIALLSGVLRLSELAEQAHDKENRGWLIQFVADWARG